MPYITIVSDFVPNKDTTTFLYGVQDEAVKARFYVRYCKLLRESSKNVVEAESKTRFFKSFDVVVQLADDNFEHEMHYLSSKRPLDSSFMRKTFQIDLFQFEEKPLVENCKFSVPFDGTEVLNYLEQLGYKVIGMGAADGNIFSAVVWFHRYFRLNFIIGGKLINFRWFSKLGNCHLAGDCYDLNCY